MITLSLEKESGYFSARSGLKKISDELKINLDKFTLDVSEDDNIKNNRIYQYITLIRALSDDEFKEFYGKLNDSEKRQLQAGNSFRVFFNPQDNLIIRGQNAQEEICSYLSLKKAKTHEEIHHLITNDNFLTTTSVMDFGYIILNQSFLTHNSQCIDILKDMTELTPEQDKKKKVILKNVAIASLVNPALHDKAKDILSEFDLAEFDINDKEKVRNSLIFLGAQIEKSIAENQNDSKTLKQFDILIKTLQFYGEKLDIKIDFPKNIMDTIKMKDKLDLSLVGKVRNDSIEPSNSVNPATILLNSDIKDVLILSSLKNQETEIRQRCCVIS